MSNFPVGGKLAIIEQIAMVLANDLRAYGGDERCARGVLLALASAIHNGSLETLLEAIRPWMREEVALLDALEDGAAHDRLSRFVAEAGLPEGDAADWYADEVGYHFAGGVLRRVDTNEDNS